MAIVRRIAAIVAAAGVAGACLSTPQRFEAMGSGWTAKISDLTGRIVEVRAEPAGNRSGLSTDGVHVRNVTPEILEVAWLGDPTLDAAWFTVNATTDGIDLRYQVGPPCDEAIAVDYAFQVRFDGPVAATAVTASPDEP